MPTGAELFVRTITQLGIDRIFTLVGDHLNEVLAVAAKAGVKIIDMRHESGVTHAADAWARITRKPAISLVTGGPGHTNSLTGIATAQLAASPLIRASAGAVPPTSADRARLRISISRHDPARYQMVGPTGHRRSDSFLSRTWSEANTGQPGVPCTHYSGGSVHGRSNSSSPQFSIPDTSDVQPDPAKLRKQSP